MDMLRCTKPVQRVIPSSPGGEEGDSDISLVNVDELLPLLIRDTW